MNLIKFKATLLVDSNMIVHVFDAVITLSPGVKLNTPFVAVTFIGDDGHMSSEHSTSEKRKLENDGALDVC